MSGRPLFFALLGYYLPVAALGQINLGFRLVDSITKMLSTALHRLYLPIFSRAEGGSVPLATLLMQANFLNGVLLIPLFVTLALTGGDLVWWLAPPKWGDMGGVISWLAVAGVPIVLQAAPGTDMLAVGRPLLPGLSAVTFLALMLTAILAVSPHTGVQAAQCWTISLIVSEPMQLAVLHYAIGIHLQFQLRSWLPGVVTTSVIAGAILLTGKVLLLASQPIRLVSEIVAAAGAYLLSLALVAAISRRRTLSGAGVVVPAAAYVRRP